MTVDELRRALADLPGDTMVVRRDEGWFTSLGAVATQELFDSDYRLGLLPRDHLEDTDPALAYPQTYVTLE